MPLTLLRYDVAVAHDGLELEKAIEAGEPDGYEVHRVTVLHADQLVAEQAGPRYGVPPLDSKTGQMAWVTLWVWAALRRQGVAVPEFPLFKSRCIDVTAVKDPEDPTDDEGVPVVDPTGPPPDTDWP